MTPGVKLEKIIQFLFRYNSCRSCQVDSGVSNHFTKVKVLPIQTTKALKVGRGIALPYLRPRHWRWGWGVSTTPRPLYPPGKTRYPLNMKLGGAPGRSGRVRKISPPTRIRSLNRPARSEALYRLSYPGHQTILLGMWKMFYGISSQRRVKVHAHTTYKILFVSQQI